MPLGRSYLRADEKEEDEKSEWKSAVKRFQIVVKTTESAQHGHRISVNLAENETMRVKWMLMVNATFRLF